MNWWQNLPYHIDPVLVHLGPLQIRYYGLMFLSSIIVAYMICAYRVKKKETHYTLTDVEDYFVWAAVGTILGGRLGYALFYDPLYFAAAPWKIVLPFTFEDGVRFTGIGGMSFHGGLIGVVIASFFFCKRRGYELLKFIDFVMPAVPAGYILGRVGNFLNGELYGRVTTVPWGMYFPSDPTGALRHPSQLYEAGLEGVFLFIILWSLRNTKPFDGFLFAVYLIGYSLVRFLVEFTREPDAHLGFVLGPFSMGQVLSMLMLVFGIGMLVLGFIFNRQKKESAT